MPIVSADLNAGDRLGPYRLLELLGAGSVGVVHRATRQPDGVAVALKVLRLELTNDAAYVRRFEREGRIAQDIDHPHLVHVLDVGKVAGRHYLAARFIEGVSLADWLRAEGPLPIRDVAEVCAGVAGGLGALHRRGIVHRDVKPSNVMLDEHGHALLTDFGLAKGAAHTSLTRVGRIVGTVDYLAPEVIRGESATEASDVYALGCVAYECVTGSPPFAGLGFAETCIAHIRQDPAAPTSAQPTLPPEFAWAVLTALAKDPARRPASAVAYARLLRSSATG